MRKYIPEKSTLIIGFIFSCLFATHASLAATITFDNLNAAGPRNAYIDFIEDGMRYSVGEEFAISNSVGPTPSSLIDTRRGTFPFVVRRDGGGLFTLDQWTMQPAIAFQESDEIFVRGFRRQGLPQFSETFVASSIEEIARITGPNAKRPIDMLIIAVSPFSPLNDVPIILDNFVFTFVEVPEPSGNMTFILGSAALVAAAKTRRRPSRHNRAAPQSR